MRMFSPKTHDIERTILTFCYMYVSQYQGGKITYCLVIICQQFGYHSLCHKRSIFFSFQFCVYESRLICVSLLCIVFICKPIFKLNLFLCFFFFEANSFLLFVVVCVCMCVYGAKIEIYSLPKFNNTVTQFSIVILKHLAIK